MTAFDIKADVLVSIALIASVIIGEDFAAGEVAFIMQLGALLEDLTVARARAGIEKLVHLTPHDRPPPQRRTGRRSFPPSRWQVGDVLRVLPGETVPVDGVILTGQTSINQAVMTGESLPVDKGPGDEVSSGTVNQFGAFDMRATKVGEDSSIQRMIRLVQSADAGKAKIVGLADRWATWIVVVGPDRRRLDGPHHRGDHPSGDHSGGILPLRPGAGHPHRHHGRHRQRHQARLSGAGGRRSGTAGLRLPGDL